MIDTGSTTQFFSNETFLSLAGASAAVIVVSNTLQTVFNFNPRWLALLLAEIIAFYGGFAAHTAHVPSDYLLSALNGCLIFCTAAGGTSVASSRAAKGRARGFAPGVSRRTFLTPWF